MCFDNSWLTASSRVQQSSQNSHDIRKPPVFNWSATSTAAAGAGYTESYGLSPEPEQQSAEHVSSVSEDLPATKRLLLHSRRSYHREESLKDLTNDLPDECISQIFSLLPDTNDRGACALVCRRWLQIQGLLGWNGAAPFAVGPVESKSASKKAADSKSGDNENSSTDCKADGNGEDDSSATTGDLSRCLEGRHASDTRLLSMAIGLPSRGGLNRLVVRGDRLTAAAAISTSSRLTNLGFQAIVGSSPGLQSLTIWNCPYVDDEVLRMVASRCKGLRRLDVMNCGRVTDKGVSGVARGCKQLQHVSVSGCPRVSNASLLALGTSSSQLTSLALADLPLVNEHGLKQLAKCRDLRRLRLAGRIAVTDGGLKETGERLVSLQWLKLSDLPLVTEAGFTALGAAKGFSSVQTLSFVNCKTLTNDALTAVATGCGDLKSLSLSKCPAVSCCGVKGALQAAEALESLTLHKLSGISAPPSEPATQSERLGLAVPESPRACDGGCCVWSGTSDKLTNLCISHCDWVDARCLGMIGRSSACLQSLELAGLCEAEDKGVTSLVEGCGGGLTSVDLSGCSQITDKTVQAISSRCGDSVRSLSLDGCSKVTDRGLRAIAASCTALEDLDLSGCDITDRGLAVLVSSVGSTLLNLSVSGCSDITDVSLKKIMAQCHLLTGLNLKNCPGLSKEAVRSIQLSSHCLSGPSCLFVDDAM